MKKIEPDRKRLSERNIVRILLKPLSFLYGLVTTLRNRLYDNRMLRSESTSQFSIVVGNLTVGGTGKTPLVEYLIRTLGQQNGIVTLSRGYGRESRGFMMASPDSTAADIGDEPLQYYQKFGQKIPVAVCENRVEGSRLLEEYFPAHKLLLLDDAFQHRALRPDVAILLNDFNRPFYQDDPFPGGRLREGRSGAERADAIITTKCPPDLSAKAKESIRQSIAKYAAPGTPCFFAGVRYGAMRSFDDTDVPARSVVLVTGIAQPQPLQQYVAEKFGLDQHIRFPDHHGYTEADVAEMLKSLKNDQIILTTEKDKVKLRPLAAEINATSRFCYIPIEVEFGDETEAFREWLRVSVVQPLQARPVMD
ncbi:tetraacyldisaccharide 4'-kinase [Persicitalea jodogahamensis]|uniref:Tetraacyldisaccharide 4'-kinase n=1 Tax=Persicitalea jodogahamensis TaxID=402147 RepID=A0A8J3D3E1_9BACT|nr:tetraacyldisaccharide 4'-kinase [Persicitalea jodogahamensis]GHB64947.1 tetraacyldisaccharide 4'-kinase [Persicitalea jodogahamensis]